MECMLNGGLSDGNPNKRSLENDYPYSSLGDQLKFKPRKISAVRDFPQGCGRGAQQIIPVPEPMQSVDVAFGEQGEVQSFKVMKSPVKVDTHGNRVVLHFNSDGETIEGNGGIEVVSQSCTAKQSNEFRMPTDLENQKLVDLPVGNDFLVVGKADGTETPVEPEIKSDEVFENPVKVQADISLDDLVGKVVTVVIDGMDNQVEEDVLDVKPMDIEFPKGFERKSFEISKELNGNEAQALVKHLDNMDSSALVNYVPEEDLKSSSETDLNVDWEVHLNDEAIPSPEAKFHRRRVSATRDFPLFCGRNVPRLAEEEQLRITSEKSLTGAERGGEAVIAGGGEIKENSEDSGPEGRGGRVSLPNRVSSDFKVKVYKEGEVSVRKDIVIHDPIGAIKKGPASDIFTSGHNEEAVANAMMATPHCPQRQGKVVLSSDAVKTGSNSNKLFAKKKSEAIAKKSSIKADSLGRTSCKVDSDSDCKDAHRSIGLPAVKHEECGEHSEPSWDLPSSLALLPHGSNSSCGDAHNNIREMLYLFQTICKKLLQGEAKTRPDGKRIDLEAVKIMKNKGIDVAGKKNLGAVPGVEVGDEFQYRVELAIVGVHRLYQAGIDYMKQNKMLIAISIVSSGAYADREDADCLIYCGQGGNIVGKDKEPEDQKLERGNLALKNSITMKNPVRVIHGFKETKNSNLADSKSKILTTYVYDGLYTVEDYWQEEGKHGKQVFMFKLKKIPGQPELAVAWKEAKKPKKSKAAS